MKLDWNNRIHLFTPYLAGIFIFALSSVLYLNEERAHEKYFKEEIKITSKAYASKVIDKLNFYSDVVFYKSKRQAMNETMTVNEWGDDSAFHIRHCTGIQAFMWLDPLFNLRFIEPQDGFDGFSNLNLADMEKVAKTKVENWFLSEDKNTIWVFVPTFKENNLIGYTLGAINIQKTLDSLLSGKERDVELALFADNEKVYGDSNEKDGGKWVQEQITQSHGISWRLKAWPTRKLVAGELNGHRAYITLLFGALLAFSVVVLIRLLLNKTIYIQQLDNANMLKETLMREINHRAKNNMQTISSMIRMQSRDSADPKFTKLSQDLLNRIAAMNLIHKQIIETGDLNHVDTGVYVANLAKNIIKGYGDKSGRIQLHTDTGSIFLDVETCVHCGLIINELVSNSLKHAFSPEQKGVINVRLRSADADGKLEISVQDNGVGIKKDIDIRQVKSLGMRLVIALAETQLNGKIELIRNGGTEFKIAFPVSK